MTYLVLIASLFVAAVAGATFGIVLGYVLEGAPAHIGSFSIWLQNYHGLRWAIIGGVVGIGTFYMARTLERKPGARQKL